MPSPLIKGGASTDDGTPHCLMEISPPASRFPASRIVVSLVHSSVAQVFNRFLPQSWNNSIPALVYSNASLKRVLEHDSPIVSAIQLIIHTDVRRAHFLPRERRLWKLLHEDWILQWRERNISCNDKCRRVKCDEMIIFFSGFGFYFGKWKKLLWVDCYFLVSSLIPFFHLWILIF